MTDKRRELPRDTDFYSFDGKKIVAEDAFTDIANALMKLRATMIKHGFKPPVSMELGSHEDGYRMRHILPPNMVAAYAAESLRGENDTDVLFTLMGIEFRYPARFRRLRKGRVETL